MELKVDLGLTGKRALVTGSTRGIGRAIAETLLDEGALVAICARNADEVERARREMGAKGTVVGAALDVADQTALREWVATSAAALGGIDVYVHNATASVREGPEGWALGMSVDLLSLVTGVEAAQDALEDGGGAVITIGSASVAEHFIGGSNSYTALKAAATQWTLGQAQVLGSRGVRCNVVSPGPTLVAGGAWDDARTTAPLLYAGARQRHPGGELGTPQDVANVVAFTASDAARHVNGVNITVDGGFSKRVDF